MAELVLDCPHCGAEKTGFVFGGQYLAERLQEFTELLLLYAFTLPGRTEQARAKREA